MPQSGQIKTTRHPQHKIVLSDCLSQMFHSNPGDAMRKLLLATVTLVAVMCSLNDVQAFDVKNKFMISALGGVGIPIGDFGDNDTSNVHAGGANVGYNFGLAVEYGVSESVLIGGRSSYYRFNVERKSFGGRGEENSINALWSIVELFGVYAKYLFNSGHSTRPYARLGAFAGRADIRVHGDTPLYHFSNLSLVSPGFDFGVGLTHMYSQHLGFSIESRFTHLIVYENEYYRTIDPGATAAGIRAPTGVRDPGGNLDWLAVSGYLSYGL